MIRIGAIILSDFFCSSHEQQISIFFFFYDHKEKVHNKRQSFRQIFRRSVDIGDSRWGRSFLFKINGIPFSSDWTPNKSPCDDDIHLKTEPYNVFFLLNPTTPPWLISCIRPSYNALVNSSSAKLGWYPCNRSEATRYPNPLLNSCVRPWFISLLHCNFSQIKRVPLHQSQTTRYVNVHILCTPIPG